MSYEEASNPQTSARRLVALAMHCSQEIRAAVAENPNTPLPTLFALWRRYPERFLQNPLVPLLLLESPNFLHSAPSDTMLALLSLPDCPHWIITSGVMHSDTNARNLAIQHPLATEDVIAPFVQSDDAYVRRAVAKAPRLSAEHCDELSRDKDSEVLYNLAKNPAIPEALLVSMAGSSELRAREGAMMNPSAPVPLLETLARDAPQASHCLAKNPNLPTSLLWSFSQEPALFVVVANNPKTPPELLERLVEVRGSFIDFAIAQHPNATATALMHLATHTVTDRALGAVARHPKAPLEVVVQAFLRSRVKTLYWSGATMSLIKTILQRRLAREPLPEAVVAQLDADTSSLLQRSLARHQDLPLPLLEKLSASPDTLTRINVATNPAAAPLLVKLSMDPVAVVRQRVALHPKTPADVLVRLSADEPAVRGAVASNPNTPAEILAKLRQDQEAWVRAKADLTPNPSPLDLTDPSDRPVPSP